MRAGPKILSAILFLLRAVLVCGAFCLSSITQAQAVPNDPLFSEQWAIHNDGTRPIVLHPDPYHADVQQGVAGQDIDWLTARHEISKLAKTQVTIAVIDTGVDPNHPDLQGRIRPDGFDFLPYTVPLRGGFKLKTPPMRDVWGHGTQVAGEIVANIDNAIGIAGIAPRTVNILPLRVFNGQNDYQNFRYKHKARQADTVYIYNDTGTAVVKSYTVQPGQTITGDLLTDYVARAIRYAILHHADIINLSMYWPAVINSSAVESALDEAAKAGVLIVASTGNDRKEAHEFPCSRKEVICVSAITNTGNLAYYSNYGGTVDVLAPGDSVLSTFPFYLYSLAYRVQGYELFNGSSSATPYVSGLAAILKSIDPKISVDELRARIFASARTPPSIGPSALSPATAREPSALYGLIDVKKAIEQAAVPVFYPEFKSLGVLPIDNRTGNVKSELRLDNLWAAAKNVRAQLLVNGKVAGGISQPVMASGATVNIPWSYRLSSLDDGNQLRLVLKVSANGERERRFFDDVTIARPLATVSSQTSFSIPPQILPSDWIVEHNGTLSSTLSRVPVYGFSLGLPKFYRVISQPKKWPVLEVYDPSSPAKQSVSRITMIGLMAVQQVFQLDVNRDNELDWVVVGTYATDAHHGFMQFRFFDPQWKPLWGSAAESTWQFPLAGMIGELVANNSYVSPESWVMSHNRLIPCFMAQGPLPDGENFGVQDIRFGQLTNHIYYLEPGSSVNGSYVPLTVHALDNANFRQPYGLNFQLMGWVPSDEFDLLSGHLRALVTIGQGWTAKTGVMDIPSLGVAKYWTPEAINNRPGWDELTALSDRFYLQSPTHDGRQLGFINFDDSERGVLTPVKSNGEIQRQIEFQFHSPENPLVTPGLLAIFNLPNFGPVWFVESQFDLIAYHTPVGSAVAAQSGIVSLDRDSIVSAIEMARNFTPVIVGTAARPLPGLYMDYGFEEKNYVDIATWNSANDDLERPARYSLLVPSNCVQMWPVQTGASVTTFSIPLFCRSNAGLEFRLVRLDH